MLLRVLAACLIATPVLAECPKAADLSIGIKATLTDGSVEEYRAAGSGLVEHIVRYDDGYTARNLLGQGVYVIELAEQENGQIVPSSRTTTSYPMNADAMPIPKAGAAWRVTVGMRDADGFFKEEQRYSWGELIQTTYQDCTFDTVAGEIVYSGDGYTYREEIHYLPQLGVGLLMSYTSDDGTHEAFSYETIETMRQ